MCHEPYMSARRILQRIMGSSKTAKKLAGLALLVVAVGGFAACNALGENTDTSNDEINAVDGMPLPLKPNLNLM